MQVGGGASAAQLLALMDTPGIGPVRARAIASDSNALNAAVETVAGKVIQFEEQIQAWEEIGIRTVGWFDSDFPDPLRLVTSAPSVLWVRGSLPPSWDRAVAIVGTREPNEDSAAAVREFALSAQNCGGIVVSGLARGVDAIAHRAALEAGVRTYAVLAGGVDRPSPAGNQELAESIVVAGGALISEQRPGTPTEPRNLVKRNRIQTGLSRATVIGQMELDGGTTYAARFAVEQRRGVFCLTSKAHPSGFGAGCQLLLREGAEAASEVLNGWQRISAKVLANTSNPVARSAQDFSATITSLASHPGGLEEQLGFGI